MLKENNRIWLTFAHPDLMQKLINAGLNLDDVNYIALNDGDAWEIYQKEELITTDFGIPTYSMSELLVKLPEWITEENFSGPLYFQTDGQFYFFGYKNTLEYSTEKEISFCSKNPIEAIIDLLIEIKHNEK